MVHRFTLTQASTDLNGQRHRLIQTSRHRKSHHDILKGFRETFSENSCERTFIPLSKRSFVTHLFGPYNISTLIGSDHYSTNEGSSSSSDTDRRGNRININRHFLDQGRRYPRRKGPAGASGGRNPDFYRVTRSQALQILREDKNIIIKPADKGGAIVVMDRADYIKEAYRQLGDSTVYIKLSRDPINDIRNDISSILRTYLDLGVIDSKTKDFLIKANPVTPVLYLLPKVHKSLVNPPGRPIIAATESILSPISIFLEKVLTPLTQKSQSYLLDTGAFLKTLHTIGIVSDDSYLVSFDVKDLYTSIPHDKGIDCVRRLLVTSKLDPRTIDLCLELLKVVLTRNYFLFEDNYYLQAQGTAMGSNMAPPYANTYMATFEEEVIYPNDLFKAHCITWKRYIDDIFCIWTGTLDSLNEFFETLNHSWSGLSFTITKDTQQISFLDTMVIKDASGTLSTDLYRKPTDRNSLLYYTSLHPASTRNAIPRSQFQRVDKLVSDHTKKQVRIDEMYHKFRERGYPPNVLHDALQPRTSPKQSPTGRIPFVHTYHPYVHILHHNIRKHWRLLREAHPDIPEFRNHFLPCYKRPRNIRDTLVKADIGSGPRTSTQRFLSQPRTGTYPCLHCNQCGNVLKGDHFHHPHSGKQYKIKDYSTCDTSFVIYSIKCPCGLLYIGETSQSIRDRISKHKSTIRCKNTLLPLPHHFIEAGHSITQLKFQVIEHVPAPRRGGKRSFVTHLFGPYNISTLIGYAVYVIECGCGLQYVGRTIQAMHVRMNKHRQNIRNGYLMHSLSKHFSRSA
ncbi:unnamed protein product [Ranitomeya imitator]|uniref:Reverse transcriptase domain-containing protein n=1 Tax=Ranitomeya imitator TaxID=111125 RepID=A0ABN9LLZ0_9NEOB|nr:unnamed protein product [Ranitomeya imitator]